VPSGSSCSSPDGRLFTLAVTVSGWLQLTLPAAIALPRASSTNSLNADPSGGAVAGSMLWTARQEPVVASATSIRTCGATDLTFASIACQLVGGGAVTGLNSSPLISPRLSTASNTVNSGGLPAREIVATSCRG
jgi:hypothetical protein